MALTTIMPLYISTSLVAFQASLGTSVNQCYFTTINATNSNSNNNNNNNNNNNISDKERRQYLDQLQEETTIILIPTITYLVLLGVIGLVGNSLVLFVFSQKFRQTATAILIIAMAGIDLVANTVAIPGEILNGLHTWDFDNPPLCRAKAFINCYTTLTSGMILVSVAVVRYRKVCTPHGWQVTVKQAKIVTVIITILAALSTIPYVIIKGRDTNETPCPGIYGYRCTTDDSYDDTIWPTVTNGFFVLLLISCSTPIIVLYIRIGIMAWRHSRLYGVSATNTSAGPSASATTKKSPPQQSKKPVTKSPKISKGDRNSESPNISKRNDSNSESTPVILQEGCSDHNNVCKLPQYSMAMRKGIIEIRTKVKRDLIMPLRQMIKNDLASLNSLTGIELDDQGHKACQNNVPDNAIHCGRDEHDMKSSQRQDRGAQDGACETAIFMNLGKDEEQLWEDTNLPNEDNGTMGLEDRDVDDDSFSVIPDTGAANTPVTAGSNLPLLTKYTPATSAGCREIQSVLDDMVLDTQVDVELDVTDTHHVKEKSQTTDSTDVKQDPFAVLKWVTLIYNPKGILGEDSNSPIVTTCVGSNHNNDVPFCVRISPNSEMLKKVEWLRHLIADAFLKAGTNTQPAAETEKVMEILMEDKDETQNGNNVLHNYDKVRDSSQYDCRAKKNRDTADKHNGSSSNVKSRKKSGQVDLVHRRPLGRTTAMLIITSAVYMTTFLPYLGLSFFRVMSPEKFAALTNAELSVYNLFLSSYFLNCAANPIIYSFCNINFRRECLSIFKRCCSCKRHSLS